MTAQGLEVDCYNETGVDYAYDPASPTAAPFSMGIWTINFGGKKSTIAMGVGAGNTANTTTSSWRTGLYFQTWSCDTYGIDMHCQPPTLLHFKFGASTDGTGLTPGGIGLDCGVSATYGTASNQGAIHLRQHRLCFGNDAYMVINVNSLEFWNAGIST